MATDETDCEEAEADEEGVKRVMECKRVFPFPLGRAEFRRGERGVAVCVELLDSEEAERDGEGDTEREEVAEGGAITGLETGDIGLCCEMACSCND